jgi:hypothetical protein
MQFFLIRGEGGSILIPVVKNRIYYTLGLFLSLLPFINIEDILSFLTHTTFLPKPSFRNYLDRAHLSSYI